MHSLKWHSWFPPEHHLMRGHSQCRVHGCVRRERHAVEHLCPPLVVVQTKLRQCGLQRRVDALHGAVGPRCVCGSVDMSEPQVSLDVAPGVALEVSAVVGNHSDWDTKQAEPLLDQGFRRCLVLLVG